MIFYIMKISFINILLFFCISVSAQKIYQKTYFENGNLKEEGWKQNNQKVDYWKFYHQNGSLQKEGHFSTNKEIKYWYFYRSNKTKESEGHFISGKKNKWWLFYNETEILIRKCQFKDNQINGYCFLYENKKVVKSEKYKAGQKIKEWTDMKSFRKENNLIDINAYN